MKPKCASCGQKISGEVKTTHRNGQDLKLCRPCWDAALEVQRLLKPESRAEAARQRWQVLQSLEPK